MTGTVVQNSLDDLSSLISFLRVPLLADAKTFQTHISRRRKAEGGISKPDYANLRLLLGCICLRRSTYTVLFNLGVKFETCRQPLADAERRGYENLVNSFRQCIEAAMNDQAGKSGGRSILVAIFSLRIFCNTGITSLVDSAASDIKRFRPDEIASLLQQSGKDICANCSFELQPNINDRNADQHMDPRHEMRCGNCGQHLAFGDPESAFGDDAKALPTTISDKMQVVPHSLDVGLPSTKGTSIGELYPSKLKALLVDIKNHCAQDKR